MIKIIKYIIDNYKKVYIFPFWLILFLLSLIYKIIILNQRKKGYKEAFPKAKIISIGNITVGGTGKTELASYLGNYFKKKKCAVLLRGYKSKSSKPVIIKKYADIKEAGDEPVLLANKLKVPIIIAKKRADGIKYALKNKRDLIIMDDAFQHWGVKRNLNIVLIDHTNPFGNMYLIPAGILREPLSSLNDADVILITKYNKNINDVKYKFRCSVYRSEYVFDKIIYKGKKIQNKKLKIKKLILTAGIGNPEYFFNMVKKELNPLEIKSVLFRDHHDYTNKDIKKIKNLLNSGYDHLITTEKDYIKLRSFDIEPLVFRIKLKIYDEKKFLKEIREKIY